MDMEHIHTHTYTHADTHVVKVWDVQVVLGVRVGHAHIVHWWRQQKKTKNCCSRFRHMTCSCSSTFYRGVADKTKKREKSRSIAPLRSAPHLSEQDKEFQHCQAVTNTTQQRNIRDDVCRPSDTWLPLNSNINSTTATTTASTQRKLTDDIITPTQNSDLKAGETRFHLGVNVHLAKVHGDGFGLHLVSLLYGDT